MTRTRPRLTAMLCFGTALAALAALAQDRSDSDLNEVSIVDAHLAESDPSDPVSTFTIARLKQITDGVSIEFIDPLGNREYRVQESTDLRQWSNVFDGTRVGSVDVERIHMPAREGGARFYRLVVPVTQTERPPFVSGIYPTFGEWKLAVDRLPSNRALNGAAPPNDLLPLKSWEEVDETIDAFLELSIRGPLSDVLAWVGKVPARDTFFDPSRSYFTEPPVPFEPFVQKVEVAPGSRAVFHGDFHGDIRSLIAQVNSRNEQGYMDGFQITAPDFYLVYLGDYTDRGRYGIEVVYTLLRLKLANPDRVFLSRGNHEDFQLTAAFGFTNEIRDKYGEDFHLAKYWRAYDFLPVAIYFGSAGNFALCCHGGVEIGYSPGALLDAPGARCQQLLGPLLRRQFALNHPELLEAVASSAVSYVVDHLVDYVPASPTWPRSIGFMWNDFYLVNGEPGLGFTPGRGFVFGRRPTEIVLAQYGTDRNRVRTVFRAHQHSSGSNPMMKRLLASSGVFQHWQENDTTESLNASDSRLRELLDQRATRPLVDGSVWTFNVAPDSVYGANLNYRFDTFGLVTTAESFSNWTLEVVNLMIPQD